MCLCEQNAQGIQKETGNIYRFTMYCLSFHLHTPASLLARGFVHVAYMQSLIFTRHMTYFPLLSSYRRSVNICLSSNLSVSSPSATERSFEASCSMVCYVIFYCVFLLFVPRAQNTIIHMMCIFLDHCRFSKLDVSSTKFSSKKQIRAHAHSTRACICSVVYTKYKEQDVERFIFSISDEGISYRVHVCIVRLSHLLLSFPFPAATHITKMRVDEIAAEQ